LYCIETDSSSVRQNKSGELWSTIQKVWHARSDPPKSTFSVDTIQDLLAHTANLVGVPAKILRADIKNWA